MADFYLTQDGERPPLEVITISDSEDEDKAPPEKPFAAEGGGSASAVKSAEGGSTLASASSACPSVMTLTPGGSGGCRDDSLSRFPPSNVSTPAVMADHQTSVI